MKHVGIDNSMFPGATILIGHDLHIAAESGGIWIGTKGNNLFIHKSGVRHNGISLTKDMSGTKPTLKLLREEVVDDFEPEEKDA